MMFGVPPATAVGTDLQQASLTKAKGVRALMRRNVESTRIRWPATGGQAAVVSMLVLVGGKRVS